MKTASRRLTLRIMVCHSRTIILLAFGCLLLPFSNAATPARDACMDETYTAECPGGHVVVMETAEYGRMEAGRCLEASHGHFGCSNDVMSVVDSWCSGRQKCEFDVFELMKIGKSWCDSRLSYFRGAHTCLPVASRDFSYCASHSQIVLTTKEGFVGNQVTDETGCGSPIVPWVIRAKPGQTINLTLLDFGAPKRPGGATYLKCGAVYGFIQESSVGVNRSICGSTHRSEVIYQSKSNALEIHILPAHRRKSEDSFLLQYTVVGCSDLAPPAHAWYRRDGNQATIGCDVGDRSWNLQCVDSRWKGVVGNCTVNAPVTLASKSKFPMATVLSLSAIISATLFFSLLILGLGICYFKRHRRRQQEAQDTVAPSIPPKDTNDKSNTLPRTNYRPMSYRFSGCQDTYSRDSCRHKRVSSVSSSRPESSLLYCHIPDLMPDPNILTNGSHGNQTNHTDSARNVVGTHGNQTVTSEIEYLAPRRNNTGSGPVTMKSEHPVGDNISSYYSPSTGHKYYVLDKNACVQQNLA